MRVEMVVAVVATILCLLLQTVTDGQVAQVPLLSHIHELWEVGACEGNNLLEKSSSLLGSRNRAETSGLVPESLRLVARNGGRSSQFYTDSLPQVQILAVKQTCATKNAYPQTGNQTFAALIEYTCRGIACHQRANEVTMLRYLHLFSFPCLPGSRLGLYSQLEIRGELPVYVDRNPPNSLSNPVVAPFGSCTLCRVLPPHLQDERYDPATACIGKYFS